MTSCSICLENIEQSFRTECQHEFHKACLIEWQTTENFTCPICRGSIQDIRPWWSCFDILNLKTYVNSMIMIANIGLCAGLFIMTGSNMVLTHGILYDIYVYLYFINLWLNMSNRPQRIIQISKWFKSIFMFLSIVTISLIIYEIDLDIYGFIYVIFYFATLMINYYL